VEHRDGLDGVKKILLILPGLELQSLGRPSRSLILPAHLHLGFPSGSFLLALPPVSYIHSSSPQVTLHALPITSTYLAKSTRSGDHNLWCELGGEVTLLRSAPCAINLVLFPPCSCVAGASGGL
jgi:hypothetical protein